MATTELQQRFAEAYVENGGNGAAAAREAGYAESSAAQEAARLLKNKNVLEAIKIETLRQFAEGVPLAVKTIIDLVKNSENAKVRLDAANALLDRGGLQLSQRFEHVIKDDRTDEELEAAIIASAKELGVSPDAMLAGLKKPDNKETTH